VYSFPNNCFVTRWSLSRMGIIALVRYSATRVLHCDVRLLICFLRRALSRRVHAGSQVVQLHPARATALRCNPALVRAPGTGRGRGVFFAGGWFGRCGFDTFQKTASVDRLRGLDSTGGGRAGTFAQDSRLKGSSVGSSGLVSQWTGLCTWVAKGSSACCPIPRGAHYSAKGGAGSCTVPSPAYDPLRDRDPPNVIHRFFASLFCCLNFVLLFLARSCLQENYQPITALASGARRSITRSVCRTRATVQIAQA
jgi:hypothetical protein